MLGSSSMILAASDINILLFPSNTVCRCSSVKYGLVRRMGLSWTFLCCRVQLIISAIFESNTSSRGPIYVDTIPTPLRNLLCVAAKPATRDSYPSTIGVGTAQTCSQAGVSASLTACCMLYRCLVTVLLFGDFFSVHTT